MSEPSTATANAPTEPGVSDPSRHRSATTTQISLQQPLRIAWDVHTSRQPPYGEQQNARQSARSRDQEDECPVTHRGG